MRPIQLALSGRRRFVAVGVLCLAGAAAGLTVLAARSGSVGCIPTISAREYAAASRGERAIGEIVVSSTAREKIYVRRQDFRLFVGDGNPVRWRQERAFAPGGLLEATRGPGHDLLYAGYRALYRSANGGQSWEQLGCGHVLDGIAVAAHHPGLTYLAADTLDGPPQGVGGGLYRTRDGGRDWSAVSIPPPSVTVQAVAIDPRNADDLTIAPGAGGVARSLDGGDQWSFSAMGFKSAGLEGPQVWTLAYGPGPSYTLWAGSQQGVFRRGRDGQWTRVLRSGYAANLTVVPDPRLSRLAFVFGGPGSEVARRTLDGGKTWQPVPGLPPEIQGISIRPSDDAVYAWTAHRIYQSADHGNTWTQLSPLPKS